MKLRFSISLLAASMVISLAACSHTSQSRLKQGNWEPHEVIDLGALVTVDLPERVWGKALLAALGFEHPNSFNVIDWEYQIDGDTVRGSNAYYTIFNHGGPHMDAPNHVSLGGGIDTYPVDAFAGPLKVFDVRRFPRGRSVPVDVFTESVRAGDVVLLFTGYSPPQFDEAYPEAVALTRSAAEYLASLPVRAFGTDALSVESIQDTSRVAAATPTARAVPIHHSFLSRGVPVYEQLFNVEQLLNGENMYFVGVPLNIRGGDGMIVRPVVLLY